MNNFQAVFVFALVFIKVHIKLTRNVGYSVSNYSDCKQAKWVILQSVTIIVVLFHEMLVFYVPRISLTMKQWYDTTFMSVLYLTVTEHLIHNKKL